MLTLRRVNLLCVPFLLCLLGTRLSQGQNLTTIANFSPTTGWYPTNLVQGTDGQLYGAAMYQSIYRITQGGPKLVYNFVPQCPDGCYPQSLILGSDRSFYGVTSDGGASGHGSVFRINGAGELTTLASFCTNGNCDGSYPYMPMVQAENADFFGVTLFGGKHNSGTVFKLSRDGELTTVYDFCAQTNCTDGQSPVGPLVLTSGGNLYGATRQGGANSWGMLFKLTQKGKLTTLHSFCSLLNCADGVYPNSLIEGSDGNFYGTTSGGDTPVYNYGTVFKMTPDGTLTTLYSFCSQMGCTDGASPEAALVQATDGNLYGTTSFGSVGNAGTIFEITTTGTLTTLYSFCADPNCSDGAIPLSPLIQGTDGNIYGTADSGGTRNLGVAFRLDAGLSPFVAFAQPEGKVDQSGGILGQGFLGSTGVSFNGVSASFKVISDAFLVATVPAGATTGYVTVTTPSGTLTSNVPFHVIQ